MGRASDLLSALAVLGVGVGFTAVFGDRALDLFAMSTWAHVPCTVGDLQAGRPDPERGRWVVSGQIRYRAGGAEHTSRRLALEEPWFHDRGHADFFVSELRAKAAEGLHCRVSRRDPTRAVLMIGRSGLETASYWIAALLDVTILIVGVLLLVAALRGAPESR